MLGVLCFAWARCVVINWFMWCIVFVSFLSHTSRWAVESGGFSLCFPHHESTLIFGLFCFATGPDFDLLCPWARFVLMWWSLCEFLFSLFFVSHIKMHLWWWAISNFGSHHDATLMQGVFCCSSGSVVFWYRELKLRFFFLGRWGCGEALGWDSSGQGCHRRREGGPRSASYISTSKVEGVLLWSGFMTCIWRGSGDYLMVYFAEMLIVLTVTFDSGGGRLSFCLTSWCNSWCWGYPAVPLSQMGFDIEALAIQHCVVGTWWIRQGAEGVLLGRPIVGGGRAKISE